MYTELSTTGGRLAVSMSAPRGFESPRGRPGPAPPSRGKAERRRARRYAIDAAIKVNDETALAIDLSRGGVFFEAARPFEIGERVDLVLPYEHTGDGSSVACTARVVRVEPRGEFHGVAAAYEQALPPTRA